MQLASFLVDSLHLLEHDAFHHFSDVAVWINVFNSESRIDERKQLVQLLVLSFYFNSRFFGDLGNANCKL